MRTTGGEDHFATDCQPNLHGEIAVAINKVLRTVHWIDEPDSILFQPVFIVDGLFGQNPVLGEFLLQPANDELVRLALGRRNLFEFVEGVYLLRNQERTVIVLKQDRSRLASEFRRYFDFALIIR